MMNNVEECLKAEYNPEGSVLRKCQLRLLDMLRYFDEVCKKLDVVYRLDSGAVLGAVRHKGFIPWDDDLDVVISKKDEKKLCDYLIANPHPQYVLSSPQTDPNYMYHWNTLRDLKSEYLIDSVFHNIKKYRGMQIDIFTEQRGVFKSLFIFSEYVTALNNHYLLGRIKLIPKVIYSVQHKILHPFFSFISNLIGNEKLCNDSYGIFWYHPIPEDDLYPTSLLEFEGFYFPGPAKPEKYLEIVYGKNYMKLPPKEKRCIHKAAYRIED